MNKLEKKRIVIQKLFAWVSLGINVMLFCMIAILSNHFEAPLYISLILGIVVVFGGILKVFISINRNDFSLFLEFFGGLLLSLVLAFRAYQIAFVTGALVIIAAIVFEIVVMFILRYRFYHVRNKLR